ncbi:hypothetical protein ACL02S_23235 [Nocardia sp. 004]|uniref:hypothetical protein n=1 Tax=Nocardia sp. 004 TaxID=3385978 RepID=UPI0039A02CFA
MVGLLVHIGEIRGMPALGESPHDVNGTTTDRKIRDCLAHLTIESWGGKLAIDVRVPAYLDPVDTCLIDCGDGGDPRDGTILCGHSANLLVVVRKRPHQKAYPR